MWISGGTRPLVSHVQAKGSLIFCVCPVPIQLQLILKPGEVSGPFKWNKNWLKKPVNQQTFQDYMILHDSVNCEYHFDVDSHKQIKIGDTEILQS